MLRQACNASCIADGCAVQSAWVRKAKFWPLGRIHPVGLDSMLTGQLQVLVWMMGPTCQNKSRQASQSYLETSFWFLMSDRVHVTDFKMSKSIYFDIPKVWFLHGPIINIMRYRTAASVLIAKSWKPWQGRSKGCAHLPAIKNLKRWKRWKLIAFNLYFERNQCDRYLLRLLFWM